MSAFLAAGIICFAIGWPIAKLGGGFKLAAGFVQFCGGVCLVVWAFSFFIMGII